MLVWVRKLLENWIARGFFALLVLVFVFWGISNVVTLIGSNTAVAHVAGVPIDISAVQAGYQAALNQQEQQGKGQPDAAGREQIAAQALADLLRQRLLDVEESRLGVSAPAAAIRQAIETIPAFQTNGAFDRAKFASVLTQNDSSPDKFIGEVKEDIASRQLVAALLSGAGPPQALVQQVFGFLSERRVAEVVNIPFAAEPPPAPPGDAVLQRYWRNHPADFTAPEYRTIKLVILSPALLAPQQRVSEQDIDAAYARVTAGQPAEPLRSVQVIIAGDLASSSRLEAAWREGRDWAAMKAMAKQFGASSFQLEQAKQVQIPSPALGSAVFAAAPGQVTGPVAGASGLILFKVTEVGSSGPDPVALRAQIKQALQLQAAQAAVAGDVDNLQDALAGQTPLDQLPGNLGLVAVQGTLDANGRTPAGEVAPIPGGDKLRQAVLAAAFAAHPGDPAQLTNGPDGSYFALTVDKITPPMLQPYDQVAASVLAAWTQAAVARKAERAAANLLAAVDGGQTMDAAAAAAGDSTSLTQPFSRNAPAHGVTDKMVPVLFSLRPGQATMLRTDSGFMVAALAHVIQPTPADDAGEFGEVQKAMVKSLQDDVGASFLAGLQTRDKVVIDQKMLAQVYQ
jgi:peptidyl-prolyl cis-trans isomerase D